ncbi:hypothetical protein OSB04_015934 [Centaurea solstitialis]|uniref:Uncharacterized protein n=1 Tax=Centaurea solstitialis TaxID=347529 RepID=A0AA38T1L0_9ASTR|nr:hypothetical protein OSB04_015934 [Centaurea solstitialis]
MNKKLPSIHMIPSMIRDLNPKDFYPRQVSIGPLHRKNKNLEAFEGRKAIFLQDLLDQTGIPQEQTLEKCVENVKAPIGRIKACYSDGIKWYSDNEITILVVIDACFILEFLYKRCKGLFDQNMVIKTISLVFDLLLIENQIPFFVLKDISDCTASRFEQKQPSLHLLIMHGFDKTLRSVLNIKIQNQQGYAMDRLIDTHEEVAILVKSKVLLNSIGSNEEAAKLINDLRKDISCRLFLYKDVWNEMNTYHNRFWPRNNAWLRRRYFINPWSIINLFAGIFLFLFTMVQTYVTINPV